MGSWNITIQGDGAHHNKDFPNDAEKMVDRFLDELIAAGHEIKSATITYGGRQVYNLGAKKASHYKDIYKDFYEKNPDRIQEIEKLEKQKTFLE